MSVEEPISGHIKGLLGFKKLFPEHDSFYAIEIAEISIVIYYTYMFDVIKIRFKILFYPRITA